MQGQDLLIEVWQGEVYHRGGEKTATPIWKKPQDWEELTDCVVHTVGTDIIRSFRAYPKGHTAANNCEIDLLHLHITVRFITHMKLHKSKEIWKRPYGKPNGSYWI